MKYWSKIKLFWKEVGNLLTNVLCPLLGILIAISEVIGLPISWIQSLKKAEYWCWNACGTKEDIDKIVDVIDKMEWSDEDEIHE